MRKLFARKVRELRKIVGNDIAIAIAGNKSDMEKSRHVDGAAALQYAHSVGATHYHTSAKLNKGAMQPQMVYELDIFCCSRFCFVPIPFRP